MRRLIWLLVTGSFLVATPGFGGTKVEQVGEDHYRITNTRFKPTSSFDQHEKRLKRQAASLCLGLEYSWMRVTTHTVESISAVYFHSLNEAHATTGIRKPLKCLSAAIDGAPMGDVKGQRLVKKLRKQEAEQDGD